jgi:hypothetical protein
MFGPDFFKVDITERVTSFEDACHELRMTTTLPSVDSFPERYRDIIIKYYKLMIITDALNEGWKKDWANTNEYIYYPWWYVETFGSAAGLAFAYSSSAASSASTHVGSRLGFKSAKLARYAGTQFRSLYEDFIIH